VLWVLFLRRDFDATAADFLEAVRAQAEMEELWLARSSSNLRRSGQMAHHWARPLGVERAVGGSSKSVGSPSVMVDECRGGERRIPCHNATQPVAVTSAVPLPAMVWRQPIPATYQGAHP